MDEQIDRCVIKPVLLNYTLGMGTWVVTVLANYLYF